MPDISEVPVVVGKVTIEGLQATNHDFIKKQLQHEGFFTAKSMGELVTELKSVKNRLEQLEIFKSLTVILDKSDKVHEDGSANLNVIFNVEEIKKQRIDVKAICGLDNSVGLNLEVISSNLFGRAAKLDANYHNNVHGIGGWSATLIKPLEGFPRVKCALGSWNNSFDHWWSRFIETSTGGFGEISMKNGNNQHQIRMETMWREIIAKEKAPIEVLKENGHGMKSAIKHTFTRDTRDDHVYPETGYRFSCTQELFSDLTQEGNLDTSRLSNINLKLEAELQKSIGFNHFVFENTFNCGLIKSMSKNETTVPIADRFFIGGPLTMRGIELRSMGPLTNDGCPIGSNLYLQHGFHIYCPLPFLHKSDYSEMFRLHGFLTSAITESSLHLSPNNMASGDKAGNNNLMPSQLQQYMRAARCTTGLGIIFKLLNAFRIELNYCIPLRIQPTDRVVSGFQFGIGILYT